MNSHPAKRRLFLVDVWITIALLFVIIGHCSARFAPPWYDALKYLNRLSDFFFVFARYNNIQNQVEEIYWDKNA